MIRLIGSLVVAALACLGLCLFFPTFAGLGMGWHFLTYGLIVYVLLQGK